MHVACNRQSEYSYTFGVPHSGVDLYPSRLGWYAVSNDMWLPTFRSGILLPCSGFWLSKEMQIILYLPDVEDRDAAQSKTLDSFSLKTKVLRTSETSTIYQSTQHNVPEDKDFLSHYEKIGIAMYCKFCLSYCYLLFILIFEDRKVVWCVTPCSLVAVCYRHGGIYCPNSILCRVHFYPEDRHSFPTDILRNLYQNTGCYIPDCSEVNHCLHACCRIFVL